MLPQTSVGTSNETGDFMVLIQVAPQHKLVRSLFVRPVALQEPKSTQFRGSRKVRRCMLFTQFFRNSSNKSVIECTHTWADTHTQSHTYAGNDMMTRGGMMKGLLWCGWLLGELWCWGAPLESIDQEFHRRRSPIFLVCFGGGQVNGILGAPLER